MYTSSKTFDSPAKRCSNRPITDNELISKRLLKFRRRNMSSASLKTVRKWEVEYECKFNFDVVNGKVYILK